MKEVKMLDTGSGTRSATGTPPGEAEGFLDTQALLSRIPISASTLRNWRAAGKIPYVQLARRTLFHWPSVQRALLRHQTGDAQ